MAYSEAQKRATRKYNEAHYTRINYTIKKADAENLKKAASVAGLPVNQYISIAIREKMEREQEKK